MTNKFYKENKEEFKTLKQYIPVVSKVHGKNIQNFSKWKTILIVFMKNWQMSNSKMLL